MTVKLYLMMVIGLFGINGCETAKRLAPPGFIKYEDIAQGQPTNPAIKAQIDALAADDESEFPILSDAPGAKVTPPADAGTVDDLDRLTALRDALNAEVADDLADGLSDAASSIADLEAKRDALAAEVAAERLKALRDAQNAQNE